MQSGDRLSTSICLTDCPLNTTGWQYRAILIVGPV